jgi:hypothetical protein
VHHTWVGRFTRLKACFILEKISKLGMDLIQDAEFLKKALTLAYL